MKHKDTKSQSGRWATVRRVLERPGWCGRSNPTSFVSLSLCGLKAIDGEIDIFAAPDSNHAVSLLPHLCVLCVLCGSFLIPNPNGFAAFFQAARARHQTTKPLHPLCVF